MAKNKNGVYRKKSKDNEQGLAVQNPYDCSINILIELYMCIIRINSIECLQLIALLHRVPWNRTIYFPSTPGF